MARPGFYMHVEGFEGFDRAVDFDKKEIRKAMRKAGARVAKASRKLVSKGERSAPGDYPGRKTGRLAKSIRAKVSRSGFLVRIEPKTGSGIPASEPYYAYLFYGVRRGAKRRTDHKAQTASGPWRIRPRRNYMVDALEAESGAVRADLSDALAKALRVK